MCHQVCLSLLRKSDDWIAACSDSQWFKGEEAGKAESLYNQWADREAAKFEKVSFVLVRCSIAFDWINRFKSTSIGVIYGFD